MQNARTIAIIGAAGMVIGLLLPWATVTSMFGSVSFSGYESDGIFSGIAGIIALIAILRVEEKPGKRVSVFAGVMGVISLLVALNVLSNLASLLGPTDGPNTQVGTGLVVTAISGILAAIGGFSKPQKKGRATKR